MEIISIKTKKSIEQKMIEELYHLFPNQNKFYQVCKHCKSSFIYNKEDISIGKQSMFVFYNIYCPVCKSNQQANLIRYRE